MIDISEISAPDLQVITKIESLLFVAPGKTTASKLSEVLRISEHKVLNYLTILSEHYNKQHGIRLLQINKQFQITSAPENATLIEEFLGLEEISRLSQASLETVAIIAYKQPTTRPEIDSIRGVNSDSVLKSLLSKGLIEELGRSEAPGRPILYGVTTEFLQHFGLTSLDQLPVIDFDQLVISEPETDEQKRILKD